MLLKRTHHASPRLCENTSLERKSFIETCGLSLSSSKHAWSRRLVVITSSFITNYVYVEVLFDLSVRQFTIRR